MLIKDWVLSCHVSLAAWSMSSTWMIPWSNDRELSFIFSQKHHKHDERTHEKVNLNLLLQSLFNLINRSLFSPSNALLLLIIAGVLTKNSSNGRAWRTIADPKDFFCLSWNIAGWLFETYWSWEKRSIWKEPLEWFVVSTIGVDLRETCVRAGIVPLNNGEKIENVGVDYMRWLAFITVLSRMIFDEWESAVFDQDTFLSLSLFFVLVGREDQKSESVLSCNEMATAVATYLIRKQETHFILTLLWNH